MCVRREEFSGERKADYREIRALKLAVTDDDDDDDRESRVSK